MTPFRPPIVPSNSANNKELSLFLWDPLSRALANYLNRWTSFLPPAPRHPSEPPRKVLLVHAHPLGASSFNGACYDTVHKALKEAGHEVRPLLLYPEKFQPAMTPTDLKQYMTPLEDRPTTPTPPTNTDTDTDTHTHTSQQEKAANYDITKHYTEAEKAQLLHSTSLLKWADACVFVYPTWWYAMPAMLKGWIERTFLPHVVWLLPGEGLPPPSVVGLVPLLTNIKKIGVVTTYGSTFSVIRYVGDPGRRIIARGLRPLFGKECTLLWLGMYACDSADQKARAEFLKKVDGYFREF